ncbi:MAG: hypothetical protein HC915_06190 [Anaerolineae bacterium]|nr:hypothetical protein [Anaerolineae bacterium]
MTPHDIQTALERLLPGIEKPGRYVGGEYNSCAKPWEAADFRAVMAFPDIYDLGMSNLGTMILMDQLNREPDLLCERVYCPWLDMEAAMRGAGIPLYSLDSYHPITDFDLFAISLPYEQLYTNVLNLLDLAGMPLRARERDARYPIVIAGGHSTYNPEPMADFIDAFVIGEGEEVIVEIARALQATRRQGREVQLRALARLQGVYVPRLYQPVYSVDGHLLGTEPIEASLPKTVLKRIVPVLPPPFTRFIVPNVDTVHNRAPIEIMRGCTRGCRFCHAGMVTRPVRQRSVAEVIRAIEDIIRATGYEEIGLMSSPPQITAMCRRWSRPFRSASRTVA